MRALLIVNPYATATTPAGRDTLAHTLGSRMDLTVEQTTHRGHAEELARRALHDGGYDAIVVHGGDGSVNEVVNGLLGSPADPRPATLPRLGIIPGGSANVFARALGIDADPLMATAQLIELLESGANRSVNLGIADGRWFLFNCGMGIDARVVAAMEEKRHRGKAATPGRYFFTTVVTFLRHRTDQQRFSVTVTDRDGSSHTLPNTSFAFVLNTTPWTYLGGQVIETNPGTSLSGGLGIFASSTMGVARNLPLATRLLTGADPHAGHVFRDDDVSAVALAAPVPLPVQIDGDYAGERTTLECGYRDDALAVVAPPESTPDAQ
ncbi:MAG TPA: diacylglycerol kinase family protein [Gordonia sp. (in: high G+C Gram-positive bacteria)]|uniref:diacylglycerol/lipid kinase family protein n=1 Tax=unclassified Gordonia (in: high G+C Gram-positive bacteria) TaxID=2657482 RepID=UPI0025C21BF4|nr:MULTISPECIES: diacylglycerol kinase family protein [unclassified Gordonia (in: high G+C Gram-positive bacteria)]HNP56135.1 diacylglycerol kinase family protein [Gordonia sp. (in: high G+C Gram-positive bacteria)]HRC50608.1 diacylglycerol kinase family protein [Gordonia sp. (in: high G+C Gram-positive bacteria)]